VPEGLGPSEVGKEIAEHREHHTPHDEGDRHDRVVSIIEAVLLAIVAVLAAWSGYSAAKWGTESRLELARASTDRIEANRALGAADDLREFDSTTFDAWFTAYVAGNQQAMDIAEGRFRPEFDVAFRAWLATNPETNPDAPPGPTYMDEYEQPAIDEAAELDASADEHFAKGEEQGTTADDYVRTTVYLATVLFLVGISGHFRFRVARYGLVAVGVAMLVVASIQLISLPKPPL
jgi:hypothetical protein